MTELEFLKKEIYSLINPNNSGNTTTYTSEQPTEYVYYSPSDATRNGYSECIQEQPVEVKLEAAKVYALLTIAEKLDNLDKLNQEIQKPSEKQGKWAGDRYCTNCNFDCDYMRTDYCPVCGAKMIE